MKTILFATTNAGKIKEFKKIFADLPVRTVSLQEIDSSSISNIKVAETGNTFEDNAVIKATAYGKAAGLFTISDDSGLVVDALGGKPGVHSHRYGSTDKARNQKLLQELINVTDSQRGAGFICSIAMYDPQTGQITTTKGTCEGFITHQPHGENGFGYDPVFYSKELEQTFAQSTPEEKNRVSHRGRALGKAKKILAQIIKNTSV